MRLLKLEKISIEIDSITVIKKRHEESNIEICFFDGKEMRTTLLDVEYEEFLEALEMISRCKNGVFPYLEYIEIVRKQKENEEKIKNALKLTIRELSCSQKSSLEWYFEREGKRGKTLLKGVQDHNTLEEALSTLSCLCSVDKTAMVIDIMYI